MSDQSPAFESPAFESPAFESPAFDDVEDDELELDEDAADLEDEEGAPASSDDGGERARAVLEHVARSLVDDPDAVDVSASGGRGRLTLSLRVAPGDMGRVIGKRGRIAQAIRALVRAAGARDGTEAAVDIVD